MQTAMTSPEAFVSRLALNERSASALRSLMQMWEQDTAGEDEETESELMVMLSGMVGSHATSLDGE